MAGIPDMIFQLGDVQERVDSELAEWVNQDRVKKLWQKDAGLWTGQDEGDWLGWLDSVAWMQSQVTDLMAFAEKVQDDGFTDVIVLGMGGSSLCPEVLAMSFGKQESWPSLHVLDSTVPEQVKRFRERLDLKKTICVVASKSGTTTEPHTFCDYFWEEMKKDVGDEAGNHFVAITDPDSALHTLAQESNFRAIFLGRPDIGGRFSALSPFGLVPAALMGIDVEMFLDIAADMVSRCKNPANENPGIVLGLSLGLLAQVGKDKVTIVTSPKIWDLGAWLEQLIAESTGKDGLGIVPVDQEELGSSEQYGSDRVFVYIRLVDDSNVDNDAKIAALLETGHCVIQIELPSVASLGAEFFRWEIATAAAGGVLNIHPFNQPNVQESKTFTSQLTTSYENTGALPLQTANLDEGGIAIFADQKNTESVVGIKLEETLENHFGRIKPGDYVAICAYLDMREDMISDLTRLRHIIRDRFCVATTLGFGPRFLHSTGQLHKGGADNVLILQLTSETEQDLEIPGRKFTFGILKDAQALGDATALSQRNRRALRVHFQNDLKQGVQRLIAVAKGE
ncbi:MAG: bifunctional transaldolase/phosoglucose isomerase [Candidatus Latescibacteria bacterium]|nr:bifunctional transaldolase/phosoglucose isomerase [Candidatus Latescibacterota bacterium]